MSNEFPTKFGQAVALRVSNEQGHSVSTIHGVLTKGKDQFLVTIGKNGGLYYLNVSTATQQQTVKIIRQ